jgi:hypothetical protein
MESRRSESAPASVATETMQPAVIRVQSRVCLAVLNPLVHDGALPLGEDRKDPLGP